MPRLAIVLRALGSIESLETSLVSLLENRPADCEILVAINQPYADPYGLAGEVRFVQSPRGVRISQCVNQALSLVRAPFVHVLAAGCEVGEGWAAAALARFGDRRVAAVSPLVVDVDRPNQIVAAGVGYWPCGKRFLVAAGKASVAAEDAAQLVGPSCLAGFYRTAALELVGGFSTQLDQQADADLALALAKAGFTTVFEPAAQITSDPRKQLHRDGAFRRALCEERLFWRNLPSTDGTRRVLAHFRRTLVDSLITIWHPRVALKLAGHAAASCQVVSHLRHHRMLAELENRSAGRKASGQQRRIDSRHDLTGHAIDSRVRAS